MKIETGFLSAFLIGLILKFTPVTGGNIVTVLSLVLLMGIYLFGGFYLFSYQKIKNQKLAFSIASGIFLTMPLTGILYKVMYWPGSASMLRGVTIVAAIFLFLAILFRNKSTVIELKKYYTNMVRRCAVILALALVLVISPTNSLVQFQYRNDPEMARLLMRTIENPQNHQYQQEYWDYKMGKDPNLQNE